MSRCSIVEAQFALVGTSPPEKGTYFSEFTQQVEEYESGPGCGVIHWHDNELDAHRDARDLNKVGYDVRVVPAPHGELDERGESMLATVFTLNMGFNPNRGKKPH